MMTKKENIKKDMRNIERKMKKLQAQYTILKIQLEDLEEKTEAETKHLSSAELLNQMDGFNSRH